MPSERRIDRSPLWPLSPPPSLSRSVAEREVELVVHHDEPLERDLVEVAAAPATGPPDSFMYAARLGAGPRGRRPRRRAGPRRRRRGRVLCALQARRRPARRAGRRPGSRRCAGSGVRRAGVAEPDDQPAVGRAMAAVSRASERTRSAQRLVGAVALGGLALGGCPRRPRRSGPRARCRPRPRPRPARPRAPRRSARR